MKDRDAVISYLGEVENLLKLNEENPFKVRAYSRAIESLSNVDNLHELAKESRLTEIEGVGKGIAEVISNYLLKNDESLREELNAKLPRGLVELTQIGGVGPKKAKVLIEELGIGSVAELEYACRENRLLDLKGFGEKLQSKILGEIEKLKIYSTKILLPLGLEISEACEKKIDGLKAVGEVAQLLPTIAKFSFLLTKGSVDDAKNEIEAIFKKYEITLPFEIQKTDAKHLATAAVLATLTKEVKDILGAFAVQDAPTEKEVFEKNHLTYLPPECRDSVQAAKIAQKNIPLSLVTENEIKGVFHFHTHASDGSHSLEEMAREAIGLGYEYIGVSEHSESAFYARGLKKERLLEQRKEIDSLSKKYPNLRIFFGIESDILGDGSLDYDEKTLKEFDFVIASIHSRFQMKRDEMTARLVRAIENRHTRMVGHLTGRILLGREPYALDFEKVFEAASKNDVAIEINAHPSRLDVGYEQGPLLLQKSVKVSINPDAHEKEGLSDTRFGVMTARKALLPSTSVINTLSLKEVEKWLARR